MRLRLGCERKEIFGFNSSLRSSRSGTRRSSSRQSRTKANGTSFARDGRCSSTCVESSTGARTEPDHLRALAESVQSSEKVQRQNYFLQFWLRGGRSGPQDSDALDE